MKPRVGRESQNTHRLPTGREMVPPLKQMFKRQHKKIITWLKENYGIAKKAENVDLPDKFPDFDEIGESAAENSKPFVPLIDAIFSRSGKRFTRRLGYDINRWRVVRPELQPAIDKLVLEFCESTNKTTRMQLQSALDGIRAALTETLITQGDQPIALIESVNEIFALADRWRARRIAMTEASRATHAAQTLAAEKYGVVLGWEWLLSGDACQICHRIYESARFVRLNQPFAIVGDSDTYSTVKHPPAHPHCQCTMVEILVGDRLPSEWGQTVVRPELLPDEGLTSGAGDFPGVWRMSGSKMRRVKHISRHWRYQTCKIVAKES